MEIEQDMDKDKPNQHEENLAGMLGIGAGESGRRPWKRWAVLLAVILAAATAWAFIKTKAPSDGMNFDTAPVHYGDLTVNITASGNLEPTNQVDVGSEVSGTVQSVLVAENDAVQIGQVLATLDTTKLEAQVLQSKAALKSAKAKIIQSQATVNEARSQLTRVEKVRALSDNKAASQYDLDAARAALARAEADILSAKAAQQQAEATLQIQQTDLAKAVIRSPINGIVLARQIEPGQTVAASLQAPVLFTLAEDLTQMALHVAVDEADVGQVRQGQQAVFNVDAYPERSYQAKIILVHYGSQITEGVVTYETVLQVENSDLSLRPGMTATADITVQQVKHVLLIPNTALRFVMPETQKRTSRRGLFGVLLPRPPHAERQAQQNGDGRRQRVWTLLDGRPKPVAVSTGVTDGVFTQVTGGDLTPDTLVIVDTKRVSS